MKIDTLTISASFINTIVRELATSETGHVLVPLLSKHLRNLNPALKKDYAEFVAKTYADNKKAKVAIRKIAQIKSSIKLSGSITDFKVSVPTKELILFNDELFQIPVDLSKGVYKFLYEVPLELTLLDTVTKTTLAEYLITYHNLEDKSND